MMTALTRIFNATGRLALAGAAALLITQIPAAPMAWAGEPGAAIDGDLAAPADPVTLPASAPAPASSPDSVPGPSVDITGQPQSPAPAAQTATDPATGAIVPAEGSGTFQKDDLVGAAEGVFGKGASGLAGMIEDLLRKQGEPNGYIVGREGGGAIVFGLRYGSGTLHHKIEGQRPVYWTGPSIGLDAGANAASTFVLVYNLHDTEDLYKRFGAGEGQAYLVGGFHVSYMRRGDIVLVPVRSGAGLRLGINAGYMKFGHKQNWIPF